MTLALQRIRLMLGGNRSGKTEWGAQETSFFAHKEHPVMTFDDEPMGIWIATESYDVHRDVLQPKFKKYLDPRRIVDQTFIKKNTWGNIKYKADDNTITDIAFKSYDQGRRMFQGAGKKLIWFDEEPPRDIWEECTVREEGARYLEDGIWKEKLIDNLLRIILTMTPVNGMTWVHDELYLATNNKDIKTIVVTWDDNPWLSEEQKRRMASNLTAEALQVRKEGKFVRMTGLVCPWFDRSIHVIDMKFDPQWTIYRAIDFGFSNPTCVLWIGVDYDDNWFIFDGIYQSQLTTPQLSEAIIRKDAQHYITNCWGDSAAASQIQELNDKGILCLPVEKIPGDSRESWDEHRARLLMEHGKIQGNGKPKIFVSSNLIRQDEKLGREVNWFVQEAEGLKWAEERVDGAKTQKPRWGKQANHAIDTLTYFAHEYRREHAFEGKKELPEFAPRFQPIDQSPLEAFGGQGYDKYDPYDAS